MERGQMPRKTRIVSKNKITSCFDNRWLYFRLSRLQVHYVEKDTFKYISFQIYPFIQQKEYKIDRLRQEKVLTWKKKIQTHCTFPLRIEYMGQVRGFKAAYVIWLLLWLCTFLTTLASSDVEFFKRVDMRGAFCSAGNQFLSTATAADFLIIFAWSKDVVRLFNTSCLLANWGNDSKRLLFALVHPEEALMDGLRPKLSNLYPSE